MSTKIYNGYVTNKTPAELLVALVGLREKFYELAKKDVFLQTVMCVLANKQKILVPARGFSEEEQNVDDIFSATAYYKKLASMGMYDPNGVELDMNVCLYPHENGKTYMVTFGFNHESQRFSEYVELFMKATEAEYFGYWNNTDPPEDTDEEEFYARAKIWDEFFDRPRCSVFANAGFVFDITKTSDIIFEAGWDDWFGYRKKAKEESVSLSQVSNSSDQVPNGETQENEGLSEASDG